MTAIMFSPQNIVNCVINNALSFIEDYCPEVLYCLYKIKSQNICKAIPILTLIISQVFAIHGQSKLVTCTASSGLILVFVFNDYVLKIACKNSYNKMKLAQTNLPDSIYLCKILESNDKFMYTVEEIVDPIMHNMIIKHTYVNKKDKIYHDIKNAITIFNEHGLCHADCRLDNVGYRAETDTFVLFDYNSTKKMYDNLNDDMNMFEQSCKNHFILHN